jgi:hypothetical protein
MPSNRANASTRSPLHRETAPSWRVAQARPQSADLVQPLRPGTAQPFDSPSVVAASTSTYVFVLYGDVALEALGLELVFTEVHGE